MSSYRAGAPTLNRIRAMHESARWALKGAPHQDAADPDHRVIPPGSQGVDGPIAVYDFADAPSVCYTECYGGGRVVEARDEVADLVMVIGMIRASALSPGDSAELMRKIRSEIRDR